MAYNLHGFISTWVNFRTQPPVGYEWEHGLTMSYSPLIIRYCLGGINR